MSAGGPDIRRDAADPVEYAWRVTVEVRGWAVFAAASTTLDTADPSRDVVASLRLERPPGTSVATCVAAALYALRSRVLDGQVPLP